MSQIEVDQGLVNELNAALGEQAFRYMELSPSLTHYSSDLNQIAQSETIEGLVRAMSYALEQAARKTNLQWGSPEIRQIYKDCLDAWVGGYIEHLRAFDPKEIPPPTAKQEK